jgi:hypothetical protein
MTYVSDIAGQIRHEVPPDVLPEGDTDLLFLFYAVLALTVGNNVRPEHVHDAWSAWMSYRNPSHDSIRPFNELSVSTQRQDQPFVDAIRRVAARLP